MEITANRDALLCISCYNEFETNELITIPSSAFAELFLYLILLIDYLNVILIESTKNQKFMKESMKTSLIIILSKLKTPLTSGILIVILLSNLL